MCASGPVQAECIAMYEVLKGVVHKALNIIIKTDCQEAIDALRDPFSVDIRIQHIVRDIASFASSAFHYVVCIKLIG